MTNEAFQALLARGPVLLDGATGSNLMHAGMPRGICTEVWVTEHPEPLLALQRDYIAAGAQIIYAPTFCANRRGLARCGRENDVALLNRQLVALSREAAGGRALVAGDLTTTGVPLEPAGTMTYHELFEIYTEQITALAEAGADLLVVETMLGIDEMTVTLNKHPSDDVDGRDACRKIAILTSLAYGKTLDFNDVYTEGITKITDRDIVYAGKIGAKVKIFGSSKKDGDRISAKVAPVLIYPENPLYSVDDVFNAILVKGNMVGDVMFYGQGAGKLATASAVVSDVMEVAKNIGKCVEVQWSAEKIALEPFEESKSSFFVRLRGDKSQNAAKVKEAFGDEIGRASCRERV